MRRNNVYCLIEIKLYYIFLFQSDFSETPIKTEEQMNNWLKFFEMEGPLICLGNLITYDAAVSRSEYETLVD